MVESGRGKYRQVEWRQTFKDGVFNKRSGDELTKTVRPTERMRENATGEAEATSKYGEVFVKDKTRVRKVMLETTRQRTTGTGRTEKASDGGRKGKKRTYCGPQETTRHDARRK